MAPHKPLTAALPAPTPADGPAGTPARSARQKAPQKLGASGGQLWRDLAARFEFGPDERLLLEQACRTADDVTRLEQALAGEPLTTRGSTGQVRSHPLLAELRGMRLVLSRLLAQLDLPEEQEDGVVRTAESERKRQAALSRWNRVRAERGA